jgi:uncharacterized lipoprotein YmbA
MTLLLCACATKPVQTRYYLLVNTAAASEAAARANAAVGDAAALAIGPVTVADYLDQPLVATRGDDGVLRLHELDRWAVPLHATIQELLIARFSERLPALAVAAFPGSPGFVHRYRVAVDIIHLDGKQGGSARLRARWRVFEPASGRQLGEFRVDQNLPVGGADMRALVAAESALITALGDAIVEFMRTQITPRG